MRAEIISVGSEILRGEIIDTNTPYLACQLLLLGIELNRASQVGDDKLEIADALRKSWERAQMIIITGGLGPTEDDLTREAIGLMMGEELEIDPSLVSWIESLFTRRGMNMPPHNRKQAMLIPSARPIPNSRGTAPGWWIEREGKQILALPGPPRELQYMWEKEIAPQLGPQATEVICCRTLKTFALTEAEVDEMVHPLSWSNPSLGIYAKTDGIHLRLIAKAKDGREAEEMLKLGEAKLRGILTPHIWGTDEDNLAKVVGKILGEKKLTLATMESCTGGLLASTLTDVPGSSQYYKGGLVCHCNAMKVAFGVSAQLIDSYGAVSPQIAEEMAKATRQKIGADIGVGITGVAGPDELEGKPPGVVYIAVDNRGEVQVYSGVYPGGREEIKQRTVVASLFRLRQTLLG